MHDLAGAFNFRVTLFRSGSPRPTPGPADEPPPAPTTELPVLLGTGGFQECSGLEIEMDVQEHLEGGRNDGTVRLLGRGKYANLVLKRGMLLVGGQATPDLWRWLQTALVQGAPRLRYDGIVEVLDGRLRDTQAVWSFSRGLPARIRGPELNAKTGEIALEELHIAHEGLMLEIRPPAAGGGAS